MKDFCKDCFLESESGTMHAFYADDRPFCKQNFVMPFLLTCFRLEKRMGDITQVTQHQQKELFSQLKDYSHRIQCTDEILSLKGAVIEFCKRVTEWDVHNPTYFRNLQNRDQPSSSSDSDADTRHANDTHDWNQGIW
jgi:hypothetical protein